MTETRTLVLVRGLPGTGKSTFARDWHRRNENSVHLEADMIHVNPITGIYQFSLAELARAHDWCRQTTEIMLANDVDVIVSNTFTTLHELAPYIGIVERIKQWTPIHLIVYKMTRFYSNTHHVPDAVLDRMKERWEDYPPEKVVE